MIFANKKKKDLLTVIAELSGVDKKSTPQQRQVSKDGGNEKTNQIVINEVRLSITIEQLDELIREIRELKDYIKEFVGLIKSRIEQVETQEAQIEQGQTENQ